jgi:beta-carotene 3-hydroxylase
LIVYGFEGAPGVLREAAFGVGVGMTVFGLAYLAVHDGFVHKRLPLAFLERFSYFRRVREAHKAHHSRPHAVPFGFFLGPWELKASERAAAEENESPARP